MLIGARTAAWSRGVKPIDWKGKLALEMTVPSGGGTVSFNRIQGTDGNLRIVEWGDGNTSEVSSNWSLVSHVYSEGVFCLTVSSNATRYGISEGSQFLTKALNGFSDSSTNITGLYGGCVNMTEFSYSGTADLENLTGNDAMFMNCSSLKSLKVPDGFGCGITNALYMAFANCTSLTELSLPDGFGRYATNYGTTAFMGCSNLENLEWRGVGFSTNIDISNSNNLTVDSLVSTMESLQIVSSVKVLTLGATNLSKLTEKQKDIARNKGWALA